MRGYFRRHCHTLALCPPNEFYSTFCRQMTDMQSTLYVMRHQYIARNDLFFSDSWPTLESKATRHLTLVHLRINSQFWLLGMLGDDSPKTLHIFQRPPHKKWITHAISIIAKDSNLGCRLSHRGKFGKLFAFKSDRCGPNWENIAQPCLFSETSNLFDYPCRICNGRSVGHSADSCISTFNCRLTSREYCL